MNPEIVDWADYFKQQYHDYNQRAGRVNIALFGKTGVGKSTLINAVFGREVAPTGRGKPVTADSQLWRHETGLIGLYDSKGFELGYEGSEVLRALEHFIRDSHRSAKDRIHVVWYCVSAPGNRIEPFELNFIAEIAELGIPIIVVLTQTDNVAGKPTEEALALARFIDIHTSELAAPVQLVMAQDDGVYGDQFGLDRLIDATTRVLPDEVKVPFLSEQVIDDAAKQQIAEKIIGAAVASATAAVAIPVPVVDATAIGAVQAAMMSALMRLYNVDVEPATIAAMVVSGLTSMSGKALAGWLVGLVPGIGTLLKAGVAAGLTLAMGHSWVQICKAIQKNPEIAKSATLLRPLFEVEFKKRFKAITS